jgi:hypothetical protein
MLGVGLHAFYSHDAARLFLRLLFLLVSRCDGFIVRPACVVQGHFVHSSSASLYNVTRARCFRKSLRADPGYPGSLRVREA